MIIVAIDNNYNNGLVDFIINVKLPIPVLALGWEHGLSSLANQSPAIKCPCRKSLIAQANVC